ncbi:MAG: nucleotidyltransferase domain-containing protein [Bdellovibrionaceae bacterium]|nr:nucleotidyltransferase domain-containing protein [Pseudobdellovibrionaceae bacterium]
MIAGLNSSEFEFIQNKLIRPLKSKGAQVFLFGSRAKGNHKKFSDIDLLYCLPVDKKIPGHFIHQLLMEIEESNFPYKIDLVGENELAQSYKDRVLLEKQKL